MVFRMPLRVRMRVMQSISRYSGWDNDRLMAGTRRSYHCNRTCCNWRSVHSSLEEIGVELRLINI